MSIAKKAPAPNLGGTSDFPCSIPRALSFTPTIEQLANASKHPEFSTLANSSGPLRRVDLMLKGQKKRFV
jgi:hypothetical protein